MASQWSNSSSPVTTHHRETYKKGETEVIKEIRQFQSLSHPHVSYGIAKFPLGGYSPLRERLHRKEAEESHRRRLSLPCCCQQGTFRRLLLTLWLGPEKRRGGHFEEDPEVNTEEGYRERKEEVRFSITAAGFY